MNLSRPASLNENRLENINQGKAVYQVRVGENQIPHIV